MDLLKLIDIICTQQVVKVTYYEGTFNLTCNEASPKSDSSDLARHQVLANYCYFLLKVLDLLDTVSTVLKQVCAGVICLSFA